jgi:hypothetical protein
MEAMTRLYATTGTSFGRLDETRGAGPSSSLWPTAAPSASQSTRTRRRPSSSASIIDEVRGDDPEVAANRLEKREREAGERN